MSIEIYGDVFIFGGIIVPRSSLLPSIGIKKYSRSYGSGEKAIDLYKAFYAKAYRSEIADWLLSN